MPKLPSTDGRKVLRFLTNKKGFQTLRSKGGHALVQSPEGVRVTIPIHGTLKRGTLASILKTAEIDIEVFIAEWTESN